MAWHDILICITIELTYPLHISAVLVSVDFMSFDVPLLVDFLLYRLGRGFPTPALG